MNVLYYEWGSYIYKDVISSFEEKHIKYTIFTYKLSDKHCDEGFEKEFLKYFSASKYDAVFSVNYFPVLATICKKNNVKYISWSYDNPLNVLNIENTLGYETNYVFMFDRLQAEKYINKGFKNVYHLPLAVNTKRLDMLLSGNKKYISDISFVGNLYPSALSNLLNPLTDYQKGYIQGICSAQEKIYGYYLIDKMLTDDFIKSLNARYKEVKPDTDFVLPREALSFAMAAEITRQERLKILGLLSKHFKVDLYSRDEKINFANINSKGPCDYYDEMPRIFNGSKINLNITLKILESGIPLRILDILGSGGFAITNYQPEVAENFTENEIVMYESIEDAFAKVNFYMNNDDLRNDIAVNGYKKVKEKYTYDQRFEYIFKIAGLI